MVMDDKEKLVTDNSSLGTGRYVVKFDDDTGMWLDGEKGVKVMVKKK